MSRKRVEIQEKQWILVCSNVMNGIIRLPLSMGEFSYYWTIRLTGEPAPSDVSNTEVNDLDSGNAQVLFEGDTHTHISNCYPLDVYVWAFNSDDDNDDLAEVIIDL